MYFTKRMDGHEYVNNDIYSSEYYRTLSELTIIIGKDPTTSFLSSFEYVAQT